MLNFESKVSVTSTDGWKKKCTTADTLRHTDTDMMGDYSMGSQTHTHTHTHTRTRSHAHMHTHISTLSLSLLSLTLVTHTHAHISSLSHSGNTG